MKNLHQNLLIFFALALCGLFVAFLVGRQIYLNRKSQDLLAGATLA